MYKAAQGIEAYVYEDKIEDADAGGRACMQCSHSASHLLWCMSHCGVCVYEDKIEDADAGEMR
jgi:hypothetical protein